MRPLYSIRQILIWLCVYPDRRSSKYRTILMVLIAFVSNIIALVGSIAYFIKFLPSDLEKCLYAMYQIAAMIPLVVIILVLFGKRKEMKCIFQDLETIYNKCKRIIYG